MSIRRISLIAVLFLIGIPTYAHAQDSHPKVEVFAGYSYFSRDISIDNSGLSFADSHEGNHGAGFSVSGNLSGGVGVVGDFSYHRKTIALPGPDVKLNTFLYLFGPQFTARGRSVDAFVHALAGGVRTGFQDFGADRNLALGFGGGLDFKVSKGFGFRGQADYIPTRTRDPFTLNNQWDHNLRFQAGVVMKF